MPGQPCARSLRLGPSPLKFLSLCRKNQGRLHPAMERPDANSAAVFLEEQLVARANTHSAPNLVGHCDLSFACDSRLLLHSQSSVPYFITLLLTCRNLKSTGHNHSKQGTMCEKRKASPVA